MSAKLEMSPPRRIPGPALMAALMIALAGAPGAARAATPAPAAGNVSSQMKLPGGFFLPNAQAARTATVTTSGTAQTSITVLTEAVAVKETGPRATVKKFGEVYAFSPAFIAVRRDEPTAITFWNLQPDDEHDFALLGRDGMVLMYVKLAPLTQTSYVFTFHREGVFAFKCLRHQPEMAGQFLVTAPSGGGRTSGGRTN
ncbi:MAG: cupredoxin domain-containing protein [Candidatus Binataceae bacterium]